MKQNSRTLVRGRNSLKDVPTPPHGISEKNTICPKLVGRKPIERDVLLLLFLEIDGVVKGQLHERPETEEYKFDRLR